jgi:GAF domain-containing protein
MKTAPIPLNEQERLNAVAQLGVLDSQPEERFDKITKEALVRFRVPIAVISIIDSGREWFKSCQGLDNKEGPRSTSFCGHALLSKSVYIIEDTLLDSDFSDNPQVTGKPFIRFYAGVALRNRKNNLPVGVFCIKDIKPRKMTAEDVAAILDFATRAEKELNNIPK